MNDDTELDRSWDRLTRLVTKAGGPDTSGWELIDGECAEGDRSRTPWVVVDEAGRTVLTLGMTRRHATNSLSAMTNVLAVVLGV